MSLTSQAIVSLTHYVLDGVTWADDRVLEQPIDPIGDLLQNAGTAQKPWIAVYVESARYDINGRETQGMKGSLALKIFVYVSPGKTELPDGYAFKLDGTRAGLALNLVGRQVDAAFHGADTGWLAVWKKFIVNFHQREVRYMLVEIENGVRVPAMEITYTTTAIPDPDFGMPMTTAWAEFDQQLRAAGGEKTVLADLLKELIENPTGLPEYELLQRNFGLTDAALSATGLAPVSGATTDAGDPVGLVDVTIHGDTLILPEDE
jgi:hypothetical protein